MQVTFTNNSSDDIFLSTLYRNLASGESVKTRRTYEDLQSEQELKKLLVTGDISIATESEAGDGVGLGLSSIKRTFAFDDSDIAVAATSAEIDLGGPLPPDAVVVGLFADITADWDDGAAGTFAADVGNATDDDKFTATELDIDGGVSQDNRSIYIPAGGDTLRVTFSGSANLSTLTSGVMELTIWFYTAETLLETAP